MLCVRNVLCCRIFWERSVGAYLVVFLDSANCVFTSVIFLWKNSPLISLRSRIASRGHILFNLQEWNSSLLFSSSLNSIPRMRENTTLFRISELEVHCPSNSFVGKVNHLLWPDSNSMETTNVLNKFVVSLCLDCVPPQVDCELFKAGSSRQSELFSTSHPFNRKFLIVGIIVLGAISLFLSEWPLCEKGCRSFFRISFPSEQLLKYLNREYNSEI